MTNLTESELIDFRELAKTIRSRLRLIILFGITFLILAGIAAALKTPVYRAEVLMARADSASGTSGLSQLAGSLGGLASLAGVSLGGGSNLDEAIATLSSFALIEDYIRKNDLIKVIFEKQWDASTQSWKKSMFASNQRDPSLWQAAQVFRQNILVVSQDKKNLLVQIFIKWKDPVVAAKWANDLVAAANDRLRGRAIEVSNRNLKYLNEQLEKASNLDLQEAIARLIETETKNVMLAQGNEQYALKIIDPAAVPEEIYSPNKLLFMAVGAFLGVILGAGIALFLGPRG